MVIWYIFFRFGMLYREKSGNPGKQIGYPLELPNINHSRANKAAKN
jgi:hypothetical protein